MVHCYILIPYIFATFCFLTEFQMYTSGRQLKIIFLDVLDHSEYSDTNISDFFFSRKHSFLNEKAKCSENLRDGNIVMNNFALVIQYFHLSVIR